MTQKIEHEESLKRKRRGGHPCPSAAWNTRLVAARDACDYYAGHLDSAAEHTSYLTADFVDDFAIAGPAERCLDKIRELSELGVDEVSTAYLNGRFEQMELIGRAIVPALQGAAA